VDVSPPPSPPHLPPLLVAHMSGDPHIVGAHGDRADFRGTDGGLFCVLSARNLSMSVRIQERMYRTPFSKQHVNGSWIREAFWVVRTDKGCMLNITFRAMDAYGVMVHGCGRRLAVHHSDPPLAVDNVRIHLRRRTAAVVVKDQWHTSAWSTYNHPHLYIVRLDVNIKQLGKLPIRGVWPHGLIGQTFDADSRPLHGNRDSYARLPSGKLTTKAQAEGAIEGNATDYRLSSPFSTHFRFSRFDAVVSAPRDIKGLLGPDAESVLRATFRSRIGVDLWPADHGYTLPHVNLQGADLGSRRASSSWDCHGKCALEPQCIAFTFIVRTASRYPCWLKAAKRVRSMVPVRNNGTTSGLVSGWKKRLPKFPKTVSPPTDPPTHPSWADVRRSRLQRLRGRIGAIAKH